ncbi:hypothetical protein OOU_Y34scaffold00522g57 [Pyricularia oryzae Y34]|uniref:Uncharacterized protein n=1 Tax=Pyricularia oryzae (strain Y34) TaxID=1143189 RepID=A0AA97PLD8_PYRO3|nr:hypothetical protein OOU_Y34scaffold00522g57 [Pyricularia oryzae Y34]
MCWITNPAIVLSYQDSEGRTSTQVGDHWGILGVMSVTFLGKTNNVVRIQLKQ